MISPSQRTVLTSPVFTDRFTSALSRPVGRQPGIQGVGYAVGRQPGIQAVGGVDWGSVLTSLAPGAQTMIASALRSAGVPAALVESGQAVALSAEGYTFPGGRVTLKSGDAGTPIVSPTGAKLLLLDNGNTLSYSDADVGAPAAGGGGAPAGGSGTAGGSNTMLIVVAVLAAVLILKR